MRAVVARHPDGDREPGHSAGLTRAEVFCLIMAAC